MSGATLLKFPVTSATRHIETPIPPPSDVIDRGQSRRLLDTANYVIDSSKSLVEFMSENRRLSRQMGIDTAIVELSGIEASGKLENVRDALEETVASGTETRLTVGGLSYLRRAEKLVAEVSESMGHFTGDVPPPRHEELGRADIGLERTSFSNSLTILGLVSIVAFATLVIVLSMNKK